MNYTIILASSSKYRQQLLARLGIDFQCFSPNIDETPIPSESPEELVTRLSINKAKSYGQPDEPALIIGSDQVAYHDNKILTKAGEFEIAKQQLLKQSGKKTTYYTGLCVYCAHQNEYLSTVITYEVVFRHLDEATIERYLLAEQPYDCAGSLKSEGLGISLLEKLSGDDPTALIGLPLIELSRMLRHFKVCLP